MFRTKSFLEIIGSMMAQMRASQSRVTDYNVGSVARTMLEAPAAEIDQLYQEMAQGLVEGIPTAIYRSFNFPLQDALSASGVLRIYARPYHTDPIPVPLGFLASTTTGQRFQTAEPGVIPVDADHIDLLAVAVEPGVGGNVGPGSITRIISSGLGIIGATNPRAFSEGRGKETDGERKLRFREFVKSLACGTVASLGYIAKTARIVDPVTATTIERVLRVAVEESPGHIIVYIHNGAGNTTPALVARAQQLIDGYDDEATNLPVTGYRPAGSRTDVIAQIEIPMDVALVVDAPLASRTETLKDAIRAALRDVIRATPSRGRLKPLDLVNAALALEVVSGAEIVAPTTVAVCPPHATFVPGILTVDWAA